MTGCHGMVVVTTERPHRAGSGSAEQVRLQLRLRGQQPAHPGRGDRVTVTAHPQDVRQVARNTSRVLGRQHVLGRAALQDRSVEQPPGSGHGEQRPDAHRTSRLTEDGHVVRVAAEAADVLAHPLKGGDLVEQPDVRDPVPEVEETLGPRAPVDDDADHAVAGEVAAVVGGRRAELEHATLDPHHHR